MKTRFVIIPVAIALLGISCGGSQNNNITVPDTTPITLEMWRVFDSAEVFDRVVERYQEIHPNVSINITTKDYSSYELEVANAIAASAGPDLWIIRNDWLPKHADKLQTMPEGTLAIDGAGNRGEQTNEEILADRYPAVVQTDAILDKNIYGIPLSIDTLALYYNKDHLREAGITTAPSNWTEFVDTAQKLTQYEDAGHSKITRAGAAIGSAKNVNRATDVLALLMLQNHTQMTSDDQSGSLIGGAITKEGGGLTYPGTSALEFYTGFANPRKTAYVWNNDLTNSIDAFASGKVSMIFSYSYLGRTLLQKNPTLNYGVAPMPQIENTTTPVDYPTYWLEVVSRNSKNSAAAWDFMSFLAREGDELYQQATNKPPAKKIAAIPKPSERILNTDPGSPWTFQTTTAASWYRGENPGKIEQIFAEMIESVVTFGNPPQVAIDNASAQITRLLQGEKKE